MFAVGVFIILNFVVSLISSFLIPFGSFPYKELILSSNLPLWIASFANFDGAHYLRIADFGYLNYEQAFFPLYSILVHVLNFLLNNLILSGIVLSLTSLLFGLKYFVRYITHLKLDKLWTVLFLLFFPTSFFFQSVYSEGLFFFLCAASLYYIAKGELKKGSVLSIFASACRLSGIFLFFPLLFKLIEQKKKGYSLIYLLFPFFGVVLYSLFLNFKFNDPLLFYHAQSLFGAHRTSSGIVLLPQIYIRYIKIILSFKLNLSYWVALFEFVTFNTVFWVLASELLVLFKNKRLNMDRLGLNLFSFANIIMPTLTGTLSSIPRYSLFAFSFFIILGNLKNRRVKIIVLAIFLIIHAIVLTLFVRGYFVS